MTRHLNFILKAVSLIAILIAFGCYQSVAQSREAVVAERESEIAEVEAYNAAILAESGAGSTIGYADGTYEGTGVGFGGDITVSVTVADGQITDIQVISADGEDPAYYNQALSVLDEILKAQSAEVDTVSGATYSSTGLIDAAAAALEQAETEIAADPSGSSAGYTDGTYEGTGVGFGGDITVSVTVADGKITDIQVISADGEDPAYYNQAVSVVDAMLEAQSTEVDTVSGATYSSTGLIDAVSDALGKAVS